MVFYEYWVLSDGLLLLGDTFLKLCINNLAEFYTFVVSIILLILPLESVYVGSEGEYLHSPSIINLY